MTQVLELSDKNFKITMTNRLKYQLEKIGNLNKEMGNFNRDVETIRKSQMWMTEIEHIIKDKESPRWAHQFTGHNYAKAQISWGSINRNHPNLYTHIIIIIIIKDYGTIQVIRVPGERKESNEAEKIWTVNNLPKIIKDFKSQMQEFQRTPRRIN